MPNRASDIDLAVSGKQPAAFHASLEEEAPTIFLFDVVDLDAIQNKDLLHDIQKEGIVLYEKI